MTTPVDCPIMVAHWLVICTGITDRKTAALSGVDPRFDTGLDLLEKEHSDLDLVLNSFARAANRIIQLARLDEVQAHDKAGILHSMAETIETFLKRHQSDEEDLAVPIILHYRLRG